MTDPEQYDSLRRENDAGGPGIDFIYGIKEGVSEIQAIRFRSSEYSPAEAREWLAEHDFDAIEFEEATGDGEAERAEPNELKAGDFVQWDSSGGTARGRIEHVMREGTLGVPDTEFSIDASAEDPAALIRIYREGDEGWEATETLVGHGSERTTEVGGAGNPTSANVPDDLETERKLEEEANVSYGLKLALTEQNEWIPRSALILYGFTPTAGEVTDTHFAASYVTGWKFSNGWSWDSALRYSTGSAELDRFNVWTPSTVIKVPVGERWKAHLEYFGIFSEGRERETAQQFISAGAHYLITPDWELGAHFGWGLNDQTPNFFANVGGGYRF